MSADRLNLPEGSGLIGQLRQENDRLRGEIKLAEKRGWRLAQVHYADVAGQYPLDHFTYDPKSNHGEILRLRDTISEAILKDVPLGEMIR